MNKYKNKKVNIDDIVFDSKKEAKRYLQLCLLEKKGEIKDLQLQPKFLLQKSFLCNGKFYREINYIADFSYIKSDGTFVVEDVKGVKTPVFKLKMKMFLKIMQENNDNFEFILS